MRGRLDVVEIERGDVLRVLEDRAQLLGEILLLGVIQLETSEARDVLDVGARDAFCHAAQPRRSRPLRSPRNRVRGLS